MRVLQIKVSHLSFTFAVLYAGTVEYIQDFCTVQMYRRRVVIFNFKYRYVLIYSVE